MPAPKVGEIFGRLMVIEMVPTLGNSRRVRCRCECGNIALVSLSNLRRGNTSSCGCLWRATITKHGQAHTGAYSSWEHMLARCKPDYKQAHLYHGRGISVSPVWSGPGGFARFYAELGDRPPRTSLDRIDNNLGYEPGNCRWATHKQQHQNTRSNVRIALPANLSATLNEACRLTGVRISSVTKKIRRENMTHQEAFDYYLSRKAT